MNNTINGRTPEEIKLWVEYMSTTNVAKKIEIMNQGCPYQFNEDIAADALAYIQQLERERDAAVQDLKVYKFCTACKHDKDDLDANKSSPCFGCHSKSNWEWRGPQEVDN